MTRNAIAVSLLILIQKQGVVTDGDLLDDNKDGSHD